MSSDEKRWVILLIAVLIIGGIILGAFIKSGNKDNKNTNLSQQNNNNKGTIIELDDGTRINTDKQLTGTKKYNDLEISNIRLTEKDGITRFIADVKNIGNTKHEEEIVQLILISKDGNELAELNPIIGEIKPGETIKIDASITADIINAKDIKIEEKD